MPERSYSTPEAFRQALEQRIRRAAQAEGRDMSRLRQLLVFDRFLARLFAKLGDRVVVKGGLILELRLDLARTTKDVDLRMTGDPRGTLEALRDADLRWRTLADVFDAVPGFLDPMLQTVAAARTSNATWSPRSWTWE